MKNDKFYAKITIRGRDIDLILTEDQVMAAIKAALNDSDFVCQNNQGCCWPIENPLEEEHTVEECSFWRKLFKTCNK